MASSEASGDAARERELSTQANADYTDGRAAAAWDQAEIAWGLRWPAEELGVARKRP